MGVLVLKDIPVQRRARGHDVQTEVGVNRLYIFASEPLYNEAPLWTNFRGSLKGDEWPADALRERYNAELIMTHDQSVPFHLRTYIEFKSDEELILFKLRWA